MMIPLGFKIDLGTELTFTANYVYLTTDFQVFI
jgi:hypothetical protein